MVAERIPVDEARRIALGAQGFADPRPSGRIDVRHLRRVINRMGVLQLDSVNVVCRSHYLPPFARLGSYPGDTLDRMSWGDARRELFEYWGHRASLLPLGLHRLFRWRMNAAEAWNWETWSWPPSPGWKSLLGPLNAAPWAVLEGMMRLGKEQPGFVDEVLAMVTDRGPVAARELQNRPGSKRGTMWNWSDVKIALEWLFFMGKVTTATRHRFERIYDITQRVLPQEVLAAPTPSPEDAQRELIRVAARALGIATEKQLRDYFVLRADEGNPRIADLVESGELVPLQVGGISQKMYLWSEATVPASVSARALLSPFDSLIWNRDRTLRLFDFHYRISIYTRAAERTHGYYVMPFLLGDRLVARVDLKADRKESALLALAAHSEAAVSKREVASDMAEQLRLMAGWLQLDRVLVSRNGDLGRTLAGAVSSYRA